MRAPPLDACRGGALWELSEMRPQANVLIVDDGEQDVPLQLADLSPGVGLFDCRRRRRRLPNRPSVLLFGPDAP